VQILVDPQKGFLIYVARIFRRPQQVHGKTEHTLVVRAHQLLKRILVAALRRPN
jgi:hypothetical protein